MSTRFLVADEDVVVRLGVRAILEEHPGWQVVAEASSGPEAVEKAKTFRPDVAVLAFELPRLDGLTTARELVHNQPQIKILLLTRYRSSVLVRESLRAGIKVYLLKSNAAGELGRAVEALLRGHTYYSSEIGQILNSLAGEARKWKRTHKGERLLTARQIEVVRLICEGKTSAQIAKALGITIKTADTHRAAILRKSGCRSIADLCRYAIREGIIGS